jgi:hypothetical protein
MRSIGASRAFCCRIVINAACIAALVGCSTSQTSEIKSLAAQAGKNTAQGATGSKPAGSSAPATTGSDTTLSETIPVPDAIGRTDTGAGTGAGAGGDAQHTEPSEPAASYQLVRYIGLDAKAWPTTAAAQNYSDLYTRIELVSDNGAPGAGGPDAKLLRSYSAENRGFFSRLVSNKTDTVTAIANITVREPDLTISIPLYSISHASGLQLGNTWATNFTASNIESPLFRIGPNTGLTVRLSAKVSSDLKSQGVSLAVGAITRAVQIAAPTAPLLTVLSKQDVNNAATAVDTALSALLSKDISEDLQVGRMADAWANNGTAMTLYGCAPFVRAEKSDGTTVPGNCAKDNDIDGAANLPIGSWQLKLTCPRLSVFDARSICAKWNTPSTTPWDSLPRTGGMLDLTTSDKRTAAGKVIADSVRDSQVLGFKLASQTTIQTFVQSQDWYTTFVGNSANKQRTDYEKFCAGALNGMEMSGFSKLDAALAIRAMTRQMPQLAAYRTEFAKGMSGGSCFDEFSSISTHAPMSLAVRSAQ